MFGYVIGSYPSPFLGYLLFFYVLRGLHEIGGPLHTPKHESWLRTPSRGFAFEPLSRNLKPYRPQKPQVK